MQHVLKLKNMYFGEKMSEMCYFGPVFVLDYSGSYDMQSYIKKKIRKIPVFACRRGECYICIINISKSYSAFLS